MKKTTAFACLSAAILLAGACAKAPSPGKNDATKRFFDAWTLVNYPNAPKTGLGSVIIEDVAGTGSLIGTSEDTPFVYCTFTATDLSNNITSSTDKKIAQQLGTYSESTYYGPRILSRAAGRVNSGVIEMMQTMRVGGTRTAAIPGWLMTTDSYETEEEYLKNATGTEAIYTLHILEGIQDITKWEVDSLVRYMRRHYPGVDSTAYGYYYIRTAEPLDTNAFDNGATLYLNYTGRILNGQVFDSTVEDTTKRYRIYNETKTYEPMSVSLPAESGAEVTTSSGGSLISGFSKCIKTMRAGEKGICIFYSGLGYGLSGSGSQIPGISPLMFEIHMLGLNEDGSIDKDDD